MGPRGRKSPTCMSRRTGKPLTEYKSKSDALDATLHIKTSDPDADLVPYNCSRCSLWHLSPKDRQIPCRRCQPCNKELYESKEGAKKRATILEAEQTVKLRVYKCPYEDGWHLTRK